MLSLNKKPPRLPRFLSLNICSLILTLTLFLFITSSQALVHSVLTYKNASTVLGQLVTSSTLVWETYDRKDPKQLQYAVEGGKYITEEEHYPIYVCRVNIDGVGTIGHTEKIQQSHVCKASHYKNMEYNNFDVLINKGHLGKVSWKHWRKFNVGVPVGAIRIGEDSYIARHMAKQTESNAAEGEQQQGADFNLGRLDPMGLGKIKVMESNVEKDYDEGDVLVETEPFRYELKDIRLDQIRLDIRDNITELAFGVLANTGDKYSVVETALTYSFDHVQYWGSHEGVARGLPTRVFENDDSKPAEINWALKRSEKRFETKSVNTKLWPGTAINVTLKGNYVTLDAPYSAKLYAFYAGSEESVSRKIKSELQHPRAVKATDDVANVSPCELETILNQLVYPSPQYQMHAAALRSQLRNILRERQLEEGEEQSLNNDMDYLDEDKRSVAALAAQGLLHHNNAASAAKRSLATLAKNGQLPTPDPEIIADGSDQRNEDKRYVGALARSGGLMGYGKRNIGTLARDFQLPQNGKRNLATMARLGMLGNRNDPKRNLASVARYNSRMYNNAEKRNIGALKGSPVHGGIQQKRGEDDVYLPAEYNNYIDPLAYYWNYGTYADLDWDDFGRAQKRFLGRVLPPTRATASTHRSRL